MQNDVVQQQIVTDAVSLAIGKCAVFRTLAMLLMCRHERSSVDCPGSGRLAVVFCPSAEGDDVQAHGDVSDRSGGNSRLRMLLLQGKCGPH
mgnify:CR=1 FL=1